MSVAPADAQHAAEGVRTRWLDVSSFTLKQALLLVPNLLLLCWFSLCHALSVTAIQLAAPTPIAATSNFSACALTALYTWGLNWPILAGMMHASSAAAAAPQKDEAKGGGAPAAVEHVASMEGGEAPAEGSGPAGKRDSVQSEAEARGLSQRLAKINDPFDVAVARATRIGPEWVQIAVWIGCHVLLRPSEPWVIGLACVTGACMLQLSRSVAIGTVRREYFSAGGVHSYIYGFVLRWLVSALACMFFTAYALLFAFRFTPIVGTGVSFFEPDVLPDVSYCAAHLNVTYMTDHCTVTPLSSTWWQPYLHQLACDDGGFAGLYRSLFDACEARFVHDGMMEVSGFSMVAGAAAFGMMMAYEIILSLEPELANASLTTVFKIAGSFLLQVAIVLYGVISVCIPIGVARMLSARPGISSEDRTGHSLESKLLGRGINGAMTVLLGSPVFLLVVCLCIEFFRRKVSPQRHRSHFISYKTKEDDAAVMMLYHMLPGKHWLDVYAADRSTSAMIKGIENCDVFLVFLSPNYFHSAYCCLEIYSAIKLGKPIICCYNSVANNFNTVRGWIPEELRTGLERSEFKKAAHEAELMKPCIDKIVSSDVEEYKGEVPLQLRGDNEKQAAAWAKGIEHYLEHENSNGAVERAVSRRAKDKKPPPSTASTRNGKASHWSGTITSALAKQSSLQKSPAQLQSEESEEDLAVTTM